LHHARFHVDERDGSFGIAVDSDDGKVHISVAARTSDRLPDSSVFASVDAATAFFEAGSIGYSATTNAHRHDGMELRCKDWLATPLDVATVESSFFEDHVKFPAGSAVLDCALLMRNIEHEWRSIDELCCRTGVA
jgi:hypothetical protein